MSKNLPDADGADERRQNHRDQKQRAEKALAGKPEAIRPRRPAAGAIRSASSGGGAGQQKGIAQSGKIDRVGQHRQEGGEGQASVGVDEAALEDLQDRPEEKRGEKGGRQAEDEAGERLRHRPRVKAAQTIALNAKLAIGWGACGPTV